MIFVHARLSAHNAKKAASPIMDEIGKVKQPYGSLPPVSYPDKGAVMLPF